MVEQLKNHIDKAFENAENGISKLTESVLQIEGMSGKKTRHFYNNIVNCEDARYLEVGTWMGSSVCAAMCGNKARVVCIDNWSEFGGPKEQFLVNFNAHIGENDANFIEHDCFKVDVSSLPKFNIYMYDGNHTNESHYNALIHYYNCLDDTFIFMVDDWNWPDVRQYTYESFKKLNLNVLYEREVRTANMDSNTWWNGIFVGILQKQKVDA